VIHGLNFKNMSKLSRSSKTGKFVSSKFAKKHKATTQTEARKGKLRTISEIKSAIRELLSRL